jgi:hypothetical protein
MAKMSKIENTSSRDVKIQLSEGPEVTLPPGSTLENANVDNISDLKSRVKVTENLTEVGVPQGKTQING